jgi:hypothetical protein
MRFWGIEKHRRDGDGRFASQVDPLRGFMKGRKDFDQKEEGSEQECTVSDCGSFC